MEAVAVATAFVRHDGEILAVSRSDDAPTYPGRWDGISGTIEAAEIQSGAKAPIAAARREVREEAGLEDFDLVRAGEPLRVEAPEYDAAFEIHPMLFDARDRTVALDSEFQAAEWVPATELLRRETVPRLFETYQQVAPTVQSVAADDEHGAATLSIRALEVLRDRAGLLAVEGETDLGELEYLADQLRTARPSMAVLRNRVNRTLAEARSGSVGGGEGQPDDAAAATPAAVEQAAIAGINRALAADAEAAMRAAGLVSGWHVLTLSRSKTVLEVLQADTVTELSIAESRPAREGIGVAETLAGSGGEDTAPNATAARIDAPITVHTDAAIAHRLTSAGVDAVLVGADTVLPDGSVVNKTGTRGAAIAAAREGIPVYVVGASDKVTTSGGVNLESGHPAAVYDGDAPIDVANPTFDVTPADAIAGIVTERGVLEPGDVSEVVAELEELEPE
ncbi:NUDIX domain-containing protein [Salinarchaeum chitinilyticum]